MQCLHGIAQVVTFTREEGGPVARQAGLVTSTPGTEDGAGIDPRREYGRRYRQGRAYNTTYATPSGHP
eukprot:scaffold2592_cov395-Prasinococcus_capsulatus_cf.AAC.8